MITCSNTEPVETNFRYLFAERMIVIDARETNRIRIENERLECAYGLSISHRRLKSDAVVSVTTRVFSTRSNTVFVFTSENTFAWKYSYRRCFGYTRRSSATWIYRARCARVFLRDENGRVAKRRRKRYVYAVSGAF